MAEVRALLEILSGTAFRRRGSCHLHPDGQSAGGWMTPSTTLGRIHLAPPRTPPRVGALSRRYGATRLKPTAATMA